MSYNDIGDMFSQYSEEKNAKNCEHLKELFLQAALMLDEEAPLVQEVPFRKKAKKPTS
jgi:hypothetical protein